MNTFKNFIVTFIVFIIIDGSWLFLTRQYYANKLGHLMATQVQWIGAVVFYLLYVVAILYFVIYPAFTSGDIKTLVISGALLGLVAYGTYDLTNFAVLKQWPLDLTIIDMIWGMSLTTLTSVIAYFILR